MGRVLEAVCIQTPQIKQTAMAVVCINIFRCVQLTSPSRITDYETVPKASLLQRRSIYLCGARQV